MQIFYELTVKTKGQGLYNFTKETTDWVKKQKIHNGMLNLNILHTSASLTIQENADPDVLYDIKNFFDKLIPMNNAFYKHTMEGIDDMPAHLKTGTKPLTIFIPGPFGLRKKPRAVYNQDFKTEKN